jgi:hypothetical protein
LQESVLVNAEASDPPALFKVLIAELVSLARLWTCGASVATVALTAAADGLAWTSVRAVLAASTVLLMSVVS